VIIDHDNRRVLDVLETREKATVLAYLLAKKEQGLLAQVEEVTTDMWDAYVEAAKEAFGDKVAITIDRFHVMKNFQEGLTKARRELQNQLSPDQKAKLKGSRWWWVTNPENMKAEDEQAFAQLRLEFPELGRLFEKRESLRAIFEDAGIQTAGAGQERLRTWMVEVRALGLKALDTFCKTLTNWLDKIANYFIHRSSNGRTEGLNHGIRAILWRAYGMISFRNFRLRVLDCLGWAKP
jgi:transposase